MGSGRFSGYSCVKFVFFIFNVMFWLLGCAILGIGIWLHISKGNYASIAPSFNFLSATALCIAAGAIVLVVGFFGCCGAIMENPCMLLTYFLLVVAIFVMEIVAGILAFVFKEEVERVLRSELQIGIKDKYNRTEEQGLKEAWDTVQANLQCCGVSNYTNWYKVKAWPKENWVPESCCRFQRQGCGKNGNPSDWYTRGCFEELKYWLKSNLYIVGVVGISIGVIQYFGLMFIIFCLEIVGAVLAGVYRKKMHQGLRNEFKTGIKEHYNKTGQEGLTEFWDTIQTEQYCCGVDGYTDWLQSESVVPNSCLNQTSGYPFREGCWNVIEDWVRHNLAPIISVSIAILLFQIVALITSIGLFSTMRLMKRAERVALGPDYNSYGLELIRTPYSMIPSAPET